MQHLVTGGGGFIGSALVERLLADTDDTVAVLDDFSTGKHSALPETDRLTVREGDVREADVVAKLVADADRVYHLAAAVGVRNVVENPLRSLEINLRGTENVLKAAAESEVPTFIASSSEVYGKSEAVPFGESDDRLLGPTSAPRWGYAAAKATDEFLALAHHQKTGLPVVVGRYFNIVGPGQSAQYGMVIPTFVKQALSGVDLTVHGDGTQTRSFTHVNDAVRATVELLETADARGEVVNIGASEPTSINELAEHVIEATGADVDVQHIPYEQAFDEDFEDPQQREPDTAKLESLLGWSPDVALDRIVGDVIADRREGGA